MIMRASEHLAKSSDGKQLESQRGPMEISQTETRVKGKNTYLPSLRIDDCTVVSRGGWLKTATIFDEELVEGEVVANPEWFVSRIKESPLKADIFTFAQKLPNSSPNYKYHIEWDNLAAIPITTYSEWFKTRAESSVQRAVRKAAKSGVTVKVMEFDDTFVRGVMDIHDESPVRQGRPFWHFQKSFEDVKREYSTYAERNVFLGAYVADELIGFIRMTFAGKTANIIQLLSKMKHYDKRPSNALIAKAVEVCERHGISYLLYCNYVYNDPNSSLTEFKRRNGFEAVLLPRYYIPLTQKGKVALKLGIHRGFAARIPKWLFGQLLKLRNAWYERRFKALKENS